MSLKNLNAALKIPKLLDTNLKNKKINKIYKRQEESIKHNEDYIEDVSVVPDRLD